MNEIGRTCHLFRQIQPLFMMFARMWKLLLSFFSLCFSQKQITLSLYVCLFLSLLSDNIRGERCRLGDVKNLISESMIPKLNRVCRSPSSSSSLFSTLIFAKQGKFCVSGERTLRVPNFSSSIFIICHLIRNFWRHWKTVHCGKQYTHDIVSIL